MKLLSITLLATLLFSCEPVSRKGSMSQAEFTKVLLDTLKKANPEFTYLDFPGDPNNIRFFMPHGTMDTYNTDDIYKIYQQVPADSEKFIIGYFATRITKAYEEKKVHLNKVIPVIMPASEAEVKPEQGDLADAAKVNNDLPANRVSEKYNDELSVYYAEGEPNAYLYVNKFAVSHQKISMDSLRKVAIANLDSLAGKVGQITFDYSDGIYSLKVGHGLEANLILSTLFWNSKALHVYGDYVIGIPCRNVLLVVGSLDKKNIAKLSGLVDNAYNQSDYRITRQLFKYDGKKFQPYIP